MSSKVTSFIVLATMICLWLNKHLFTEDADLYLYPHSPFSTHLHHPCSCACVCVLAIKVPLQCSYTEISHRAAKKKEEKKSLLIKQSSSIFYFLCSGFCYNKQEVYSVNEAVVKQQRQPLVAPGTQDVESVKQQAGRGNTSK